MAHLPFELGYLGHTAWSWPLSPRNALHRHEAHYDVIKKAVFTSGIILYFLDDGVPTQFVVLEDQHVNPTVLKCR